MSVLPITLIWIDKVLMHPRPFWAWWYDPETVYFHEGWRLSQGLSITNVDNPGIPVDVISAMVIRLIGFGPTLFDPFRLICYIVGIALIVLAAALLLETVLADLSAPVAAAAVWCFFLAPSALERLVVWSPETLMFAFGSVAALGAWRFFRGQPGVAGALRLGAALGACVALKLTFGAWVIAMLLSLAIDSRTRIGRRLGLIAVGLLASGAAFVVFTIPAISRYGGTVQYLLRLLTHGGQYGEGPQGQLSLRDWVTAINDLLAASLAWQVLWIALVVVLVLQRRRWSTCESAVRPLLTFCVTGILLLVLGASRQGADPHYVIAAGPLVMLLLVLAVRIWPQRRTAAAIAVACVASLLVIAAVEDIREHRKTIDRDVVLRARIDEAVRPWRNGSGAIIYGFKAPEPSLALRIQFSEETFVEAVERLYPDEGHWVPWHDRVFLPAGHDHWSVVVLSPNWIHAFPEPLGPVIADLGYYRVFAAP